MAPFGCAGCIAAGTAAFEEEDVDMNAAGVMLRKGMTAVVGFAINALAFVCCEMEKNGMERMSTTYLVWPASLSASAMSRMACQSWGGRLREVVAAWWIDLEWFLC